MYKIIVFLSLFLSIGLINAQVAFYETFDSNDGYTVIADLKLTEIVNTTNNPNSNGCNGGGGYNYKVKVEYDVSFVGYNIPSQLWTLQGQLLNCGNNGTIFYNLPNSGGQGELESSNAYRNTCDALTATPESLECFQLEIRVQGPGIDVTRVLNGANPLPVELTYFNANCEKNDVDLKWETASELNSMAFYLEKSLDGELWEVVKEVKAAGTTNSNTTYTYTDRNPSAGVSYYRLVQEDFDGTSEIFGPISVNCAFISKEIKLFPNPSNNFFTVEWYSELPANDARIDVYTNYGQLVEVRIVDIQKGVNQIFFNNILDSGTYIVRVTSGENSRKPMMLKVLK